MNDAVLVTGAAGFIGFHVARRLLQNGRSVAGIDNINAYYDPGLKQARLAELKKFASFRFDKIDITDSASMTEFFRQHRFRFVVHLAAQVGVRHSLVDPSAYVRTNVDGFFNVLEGCRRHDFCHLVFASSSSVYGANARLPFRTSDNVDHPLSMYAATKKANELMAHTYAHLYGLPSTGLRFFTVYGPWGRPDMAIWLFTEAIANGMPIKLYNAGKLWRDFTFIDDVTETVVRLIYRPAQPDPDWSAATPLPSRSGAPWRIYNVGNSQPTQVQDLVHVIEAAVGKVAQYEILPMQPGDVVETCADVEDLMRDIDFRPSTPIEEGVRQFVDWRLRYCRV